MRTAQCFERDPPDLPFPISRTVDFLDFVDQQRITIGSLEILSEALVPPLGGEYQSAHACAAGGHADRAGGMFYEFTVNIAGKP